MTTQRCEVCWAWHATTREQLKSRQFYMLMVAASPCACPRCGSKEWAKSVARIPEPKEKA